MSAPPSDNAGIPVAPDAGDRRGREDTQDSGLRAKRLDDGHQWKPTPDDVVPDHFELARRDKLFERHCEKSMKSIHDVFMDHARRTDDTKDSVDTQDHRFAGMSTFILHSRELYDEGLKKIDNIKEEMDARRKTSRPGWRR